MSDILLCKDCKWFAPGLNYPKCMNEQAKTIDYVLGNEWQMGCDAMRLPVNKCGPEGKLWERPL